MRAAPTVGGGIRYAPAYLRRIQAQGFDWAHMRGTVLRVTALPAGGLVVRVRWQDGEESSALACNLSTTA